MCGVIQYVPQLITTVRNRTSGSLSVTFYLLQVVGGFAMLAEQMRAAHDSWPEWLPFLASTLMQLFVACICIWYDGKQWLLHYAARRLARSDVHGSTNAARLLDDP